jgi:hypothetical protein
MDSISKLGDCAKKCQQAFLNLEQIAKYLVVDHELLLCQIYFKSAMPITKVFFCNLNKSTFYPPFSLILVGHITFSSSWVVAR